ncbi:transmembrane protein, putative (macronuclear) [Tetrahymena thermophila SB210]|uniref:Transmembrane protein, putative n=1 Tax=Tetrahymena thermophila (strain SB210) TaxID=312017 RepID=W7X5P7_TETTS|nr:transmembrane protein, putative [Tetrahymena thermophila SB210]EWS71683.1 transmembrane protein, putative [Tetrahymena thermophila SB210]|eukprot:XP_012655794.1 transmembrane protein, putative [Tetrahymena thermophila SB210]
MLQSKKRLLLFLIDQNKRKFLCHISLDFQDHKIVQKVLAHLKTYLIFDIFLLIFMLLSNQPFSISFSLFLKAQIKLLIHLKDLVNQLQVSFNNFKYYFILYCFFQFKCFLCYLFLILLLFLFFSQSYSYFFYQLIYELGTSRLFIRQIKKEIYLEFLNQLLNLKRIQSKKNTKAFIIKFPFFLELYYI